MNNRLNFTLVLLLAGCSRPAEESRLPEHTFRCPEGTEFSASFNNDSVYLQLPNGDVTLPLAISASGARYANDTLVFWEHQGAARVEHRGHVQYVECRTTDEQP